MTCSRELEGVPLNDPAYGDEVGVQADGSLVCLWGCPRPTPAGSRRRSR